MLVQSLDGLLLLSPFVAPLPLPDGRMPPGAPLQNKLALHRVYPKEAEMGYKLGITPAVWGVEGTEMRQYFMDEGFQRKSRFIRESPLLGQG
jgi:hypothetical protein